MSKRIINGIIKGTFIGFVLTTLMFAAPPSLLFSQESGDMDGEPSWLLMLNGKEAYREGNYGTALSYFRRIAERNTSNADAHLWIGYVFEAEGEFESAKRKYLQSIEHERMFSPYEGRIAARYSLAGVAKKLGETDLYLDTLAEIIRVGRSSGLSDSQFDAVIKKMIGQGPDKVLELFRVREKRIRKAISLRGEQELLAGNYRKALDNFTLSFTIAMTVAIDGMKRSEPDYIFVQDELPVVGGGFFVANTRRFLEEAEEKPGIAEFLNDIEFYRELYLCAAAFYGSEYKDQAEELWLITAEHRESGVWSRLAREQVAEPDLDVLPAVLER